MLENLGDIPLAMNVLLLKCFPSTKFCDQNLVPSITTFKVMLLSNKKQCPIEVALDATLPKLRKKIFLSLPFVGICRSMSNFSLVG